MVEQSVIVDMAIIYANKLKGTINCGIETIVSIYMDGIDDYKNLLKNDELPIDSHQEFERKVIDAVRPIFSMYDVHALPIFAWGRYYKYELRGKPFECGYEGNFINLINEVKLRDKRLDVEFIKYIDGIHGNAFDYYPDRDECVKFYGGDDDRGGLCMLAVKDATGSLNIQTINCDSPE